MRWPGAIGQRALRATIGQNWTIRTANHVPPRRHASTIVRSVVPDVELPSCNYAHLVLQRADEFAHKAAFIDASPDSRDLVLTFADVRTLAYNAASGLVRNGLRRGSVMSLFLHNCPEFAIAQLGGLLAGVVSSPANPAFTAAELAYQLKHSGASIVITQRDKLHVAASAAKEAGCVQDIYVVDGVEDGVRSFKELVSDRGADLFSPDDSEGVSGSTVATLPYSSGTTGLPKGVDLTHLNHSINLLQYNTMLQPAVGTERYCLVLPMYHIYGNCIMYQALYTGCTSVVMRKFDPQVFLRAADLHSISIMHLVPPLILFLLQHPLVQQHNLSAVHTIFCAAAPLGKQLQDDICRLFSEKYSSQIDVQQLFGLTETSPITHAPQPQAQRPADTVGSIGTPVCNQLTRVVSVDTGEDLGPNEEGEILVKGPHVMKGYLNNPEATRNCISEDGWFSTGDIGYYDSNRYFRIVDRVKELIKVKGSQVAPAELEALLLQHPLVADCAVIGRTDERAGELPCAFVVPKERGHADEQELFDFVAERLAPHKRLTGGVVFTDAIPRNPSGKILRRKLRDSLKH